VGIMNNKDIKIRKYRKLSGRCYELACRFVLDNPQWVLIHGRLDLTVFLDQKYANYLHAWARNGNSIYDPAHNSIYQNDEWEKFKPTEIKVYSVEDASLEITKFGWRKRHYGPWD
jgi:hypothetical protein